MRYTIVFFFICAVYNIIFRHSRGWARLNRLAFAQAPCALFIAILNEKSIEWAQYDNIFIYMHVLYIICVTFSSIASFEKISIVIHYMIIVPCTMKYYLLRVFVSNWTIIMVGYFFFLSSRPRLMKNNQVNGLICRFLVFLNVCVLAWFIALGSDAKKTFAQNHCPMPSYASQPTSGLCACYTISANQIYCIYLIFFYKHNM